MKLQETNYRLGILLIVLVAGCSFDENEVAMAINGCDEHGGVYALVADGAERRAECKDGTRLWLREGN